MKPQTAKNWPRQEAEISAMNRHSMLWFCNVNPVQVLHRFHQTQVQKTTSEACGRTSEPRKYIYFNNLSKMRPGYSQDGCILR